MHLQMLSAWCEPLFSLFQTSMCINDGDMIDAAYYDIVKAESVNMVVMDGLVPNVIWCQGISNHHADLYWTSVQPISLLRQHHVYQICAIWQRQSHRSTSTRDS